MEENWKVIDGTNGAYLISNLGRVKSIWVENQSVYSKKAKGSEQILNQCLDSHTGYCTVNIPINGKRKTQKVHQLVGKHFLLRDINKTHLNHMDGIKTNNTPENLEWVNNRENASHAKKECPQKTSKYIGVSYESSRNKWCASIQINGKSIFLGRYQTEESAREAYLSALRENNLLNKYA